MRAVNEIIIHCTATRANWMEGRPVADVVAELTRWHVEDNGWSDCGYHYVITRAGEVGTARPVERSGAHCRGKLVILRQETIARVDRVDVCLLCNRDDFVTT